MERLERGGKLYIKKAEELCGFASHFVVWRAGHVRRFLSYLLRVMLEVMVDGALS